MEPIFGKARRADLFLDPNFRCINAGSFGVVPNEVLVAKNKFEQRMNYNPQKWFRIQLQEEVKKVRHLIAQKVHCNPNNLFLVQNATEAFNCLAKSLAWTQDDTVILPNTAYTAIRNTLVYLQSKHNFKILNVQFDTADLYSSSTILEKIRKTVDNYTQKITLAVFDHIISKPGVVCPVQQITQYFKAKHIPIFIDGAHALGQLKINLEELNAQCYFSNAHKWAFCSKSAAFLYVSDSFMGKIKPAVTGNYHGESVDREFLWTGTRDFSSYMSIQAGFKYSQKLGEDNIHKHNHELAVKAGKKVASIWGTQPLCQKQQMIGFMNNIQLPAKYTDADKCLKLPFYMVQFEGTYPVIFQFQGKLYLRISCHIYNQLQDYQWAANKILQILDSEKYNEWYKNKVQSSKGKKLLY